MVDPETFRTEVSVAVDTICTAEISIPVRPGPAPALTRARSSRWRPTASGRGWLRDRLLWPPVANAASPLPNPAEPRPVQPGDAAHHAAVAAVALALGRSLAVGDDRAYEVVDGTVLVAPRNAKRRGRGWLSGQATIGKFTRVGWYEGAQALGGDHAGRSHHRLGARPGLHQRPRPGRDLLSRPGRPPARPARGGRPDQRPVCGRHGLQRAGIRSRIGTPPTGRWLPWAPPRPGANGRGPSPGGGGSPASPQAWIRSTTGCSSSAAWTGSGPPRWMGCWPGWRRRWAPTISAPGSTARTAVAS